MTMLLFLLVSVIAATVADPASDQLPNYKRKTGGPIGIITTSNGAPVEVRETIALNYISLLGNDYFMGIQSNLDRQRIPERVVHTKGAGAFGYFEVTHNITGICKAKLFSRIGKKTPVVVRFSQTGSDKGEPDTNRDGRGFAIKFYTEEGNFDIPAINTPMFAIKDPILFPSLAKVLKRNPVTNLKDRKMFWDFFSLRPESFFFLMNLFSDGGIPDGYRHMPGFGVHAYQVYNGYGDSYFILFHIIPDLGIRNLLPKDATKIAVSDPDYAVRDLYNAIELGNFPTWTMYLQVLSYKDVKEADFDIFDVTKILPLNKYPLRPVGKLVLNRNPKNFFADVEQLAFCPSSLVPGILGGPDQLYLARRFSYRDAQFYRLGVNFNNIRVNSPRTNVFSYDRDGVPPVGNNGGDAPNYFPNSYNGPVPYVDKKRPALIRITQDNSLNFNQAADFYTNDLNKDQRSRMIENIVKDLASADPQAQERAIVIFTEIHPDLGKRIAAGLADQQSPNRSCKL